MQLAVCAIWDAKVKAYQTPFFVRTPEQAIRFFQTLCSDPQQDFGKFPEDYVLFHIGSYYDNEGHLEALDQPVALVRATVLMATMRKGDN